MVGIHQVEEALRVTAASSESVMAPLRVYEPPEYVGGLPDVADLPDRFDCTRMGIALGLMVQVDKMNRPGILRADFQDLVEIGRQDLDFLLRQNGSCVEEPVALQPGNLIVGECLSCGGKSRLQPSASQDSQAVDLRKPYFFSIDLLSHGAWCKSNGIGTMYDNTGRN